MPFLSKDEELEKKLKTNELQITKLILESETLMEETSRLFKDLQISEEDFLKYIENQDNFTEWEWEKLKEEKEHLDLKLSSLAQPGTNANRAKQTRMEMQMSQGWIFVR